MPSIFRYSTSDEFVPEDSITLTPTSRVTAAASPVILKETGTLRYRFLPQIVTNDKTPERSVSGKFVYERKHMKDFAFPSDLGDDGRVDKRDVLSGDWLELSLSTEEARNLYTGLSALYGLYEEVGIPRRQTHYVEADMNSLQAIRLLNSDPEAVRMLLEGDNLDVLRKALRALAQEDASDTLRRMLDGLEQTSVERLASSLSVEQLVRAEREFEANIENDDERFWQTSMFEKYPWILSQIFATPVVLYKGGAYVGGKSIANEGGNICDFIYRNRMTNNVCLIEIKTPATKLLGIRYRNTYTLGADLSGSINQVLNYRDSLQKELFTLAQNAGDEIKAFSPRCAVVLGNTNQLEGPMANSAFENFRNSLMGITVITYDELLQRIKDLINVLES